MGKMSEIDVTLQEYTEALHSYGHGDPLVKVLKAELLSLELDFVNTEVECIDYDFNYMVFNNQTEGRF